MAEKPGLFRRILKFIGMLITGLRYLISLLILVFFIAVIASMFGDRLQPLPEKGALVINPSGDLVDQKTYFNPLSQAISQSSPYESETLLRDVIEAIETAAKDPHITHLILDTNDLTGGGLSKLEEIGSALREFRKTGKPVTAIGDNFSLQQYYLAAHADEIVLDPMGVVLISGFGAWQNYFGDALKKLKVNVNVFRVGKYKSAVEPFTRNDMSPEAREETRELIDGLWRFYSSRIEELRGLPHGAIDDLANNLHTKLAAANGDSAQLALDSGLVDRIASHSQVNDWMRANLPTENGDTATIDMRTYLTHQRLAQLEAVNDDRDKVAVIVAKGEILDGEQPPGVIGCDTLAAMLEDAQEDSSVRALVLRVDSPGGSAFAAEVIRDAVAAVQARKIPVVVSMSSYAASGGYWISAGADRIFAMPTTLTGSIGVFGLVPTFEKSLGAIGIYSDGVGTGRFSSLYQIDRPMNEETKTLVQLWVDNIYSRFINLVAQGRNSTPQQIHEVAQGRVWSGEKALELGLVDEIGNLDDAIKSAASLAGIKDYEVDYRSKPLSLYEQLIVEITGNLDAGLGRLGFRDLLAKTWFRQLLDVQKPIRLLDRLNDPHAVYAYCANCPL